jgi:hypothetical protein
MENIVVRAIPSNGRMLSSGFTGGLLNCNYILVKEGM